MATATVPKPLEDRVVVLPKESPDITPGGIALPAIAKEKPLLGEVIVVGPGRIFESTGDRCPMSLNVGDIVYYTKYSGNEVEINGTTYLILKESEVLAIQDED